MGGKYSSTPALLIQPTRFSVPRIERPRTLCVLGGYLVVSGIEPRPSSLKSDAVTTRQLTAQGIDVCKCLVILPHGGTLNSHTTSNPMVLLVEGEEMRNTPDHYQCVLPQN
ncbi:hypothetical protein TNCV_4503111 [Trichonephila clavipes]|nr:hypothetical protein TNCV_4503111 [Trichonephila clavipes]